jgi:hypothetical protein
MPLSRLAAIKKLSWMVQSDSFPELDSNALGELIDEHKRFNSWEASIYYNVGDQIIPTVANGRVYSCLIAGTSGTVEPSFPQIGYNVGQNIFDGTPVSPINWGLTWIDVGFTNQEIYDVRASAREGWMRKASICANLINTDDGATKVDLNKLIDHCHKMASSYRSFGIL